MVSQRDIFNQINAENVNSNEYLEMANHCKKLLEEKDKEIKKLKRINIDYKKVICVSYGLARTADLITDNFVSTDNYIFKQISDLIHEIRSVTSICLFPDDDDDDEILFLREDEV